MDKIILLMLIAVVMSGCSIKESTIQLGNRLEPNIQVEDSDIEEVTSVTLNNFIPTSKGSYWLYRITGERLSESQVNTTINTDKLFKIEILDSIQRDSGLRAILLTGYPGLAKATSTLIIVAEKDYYLVNNETAFNSISNKNNDLSSLYADTDLILSFPLSINKKFNCDEDSADRQDNFYCYWVKSIKPADAKLFPNKNQYQISYYTNPDSTDSYYVDGVGITYHNYSHNGSLNEEKWNLVNYSIAK